MQQDFYIFRHGQTDYNLEHRWQGCGIDAPLNETGRSQALALVPKLAEKKLQIIYSSCLRRAAETADIVARQLNLPRAFCSDLREICLGNAEGLRADEVEARYPEFFRCWMSPDPQYAALAFPGGESKLEVRRRMLKALEQIADNAPQFNCFGIASHEDSILLLLENFGISLPHIANTSLYHLVRRDGRWELGN